MPAVAAEMAKDALARDSPVFALRVRDGDEVAARHEGAPASRDWAARRW